MDTTLEYEKEQLNEIQLILDDKILKKQLQYDENYDQAYTSYSPSFEELSDIRAARIRLSKIKNEIDEYIQIKKSPYFARMNFEVTLNDKMNEETYLIGKKGIYDNGDYVVFDWRSPIGQRYYIKNENKFVLGGHSYNLLLRRKINIENGALIDYYNEYVYEGNTEKSNIIDPFLRQVLNERKSLHRAVDIIRTIQENQIKIIRENINNNIIVQGCAGSGKTMILLHRLSYLIYNNPNVNVENFVIITPNHLFNNYINDLTKELEIDKIRKFTIEEYYIDILNRYNYKNKSINNNISDEKDLDRNFIMYIYSTKCLEDLYSFYKNYIINKLKSIDFSKIVLSAEKIGLINKDNKSNKNNVFADTEKIKETIEHIIKEKDITNILLFNLFDSIDIKIKTLLKAFDDKLLQIKEEIKDYDNEIKKLEEEYKNKKNDYNNAAKIKEIFEIEKQQNIKELKDKDEINKLLNERNRIENNIKEYYTKLIETKKKIAATLNKIEYLRNRENEINNEIIFLKLMENKLPNKDNEFIENEILTPFINDIKNKYNVNRTKKYYRHYLFLLVTLYFYYFKSLLKKDKYIYVDEAQNISEVEYRVLHLVNGKNYCVFNLFGDIMQCINKECGISNWELLCDYFKSKECNINLYTLNENYRNSIEITNFCNEEFQLQIIPIGLHRNEVKIVNIIDATSIILNILNSEIYERIAIIFKDLKTKGIDNILNLLNISEKKELYILKDSNLYISTINWIKGIEFDKVFVFIERMNDNEKYVAFTRALNDLIVIN